MSNNKLSVFLSYLLRHNPGEIGLDMDKHGWVDVNQLLGKINAHGKYTISRELLDEIVATDNKGRYRYDEDRKRIKACQGHSIQWVEPELSWQDPPNYLYHGTTLQAYHKILESGAILKMSRHAVHMQADPDKAWQSARRWHQTPVVIRINAGRMAAEGYRFGVSDNGVWCTETVPVEYIAEPMYEQ